MSGSSRATARIVAFDCLLIAFATGLGLWKTGNPSRYFGEGRFTMVFSCVQLLAVALLAARIFQLRRAAAGCGPLLSPRLVWALVASGFVFLACDEALQLHEKFDSLIHRTFHWTQSPLTDRIDDALIALYGCIGLGVLWIYRREVLIFRGVMLPPLVAGFLAAGLSVACDTIANGDSLLLWLTGDLARTEWLEGWLAVGDGAFTLLAEGFFVAAFFAGYQEARSPAVIAAAHAATSAAPGAASLATPAKVR